MTNFKRIVGKGLYAARQNFLKLIDPNAFTLPVCIMSLKPANCGKNF